MKRIIAISTLLIVASITLGLNIVPASAAGTTCTWNNGSGNMSDTSKWSCTSGTLPGDGDNVVIIQSGDPSEMLALVNDVPGNPRYASISITGNVGFTGAVLNISGDLTTATGTFHAGSGVNLVASTDVEFKTTSSDPSLQPNFFLNNIEVSLGSNNLRMLSTSSLRRLTTFISLTGTLGTLELKEMQANVIGGPSTYTASEEILLDHGAMDCQGSACLGDASNDLTLTNTSEFQSRVTETYANEIFMNDGYLRSFEGSPTFSGTIHSQSFDDHIYAYGTDSVITCSGNIILDESELTINADNYSGNAKVVTTGNISGTGNITVSHDGVYEINGGTSSFTGTFEVQGLDDPDVPYNGRALIVNAAGFSPDATYVVDEFASIQTRASGTVASNFVLTGSGFPTSGYEGALSWTRSASGNLELAGDIELDGDTTINNNSTDFGLLSMSGVITGTGDLTIVAPSDNNQAEISGTDPNELDGDITQVGGYLTLAKDGAVPHDIFTEEGPGGLAFLGIFNNSGNAIGNALHLNGAEAITRTVTLKGLTGDGTLQLGDDVVVTLDIAEANTFEGIITDDSNFIGDRVINKTGPGIFIATNAGAPPFYQIFFNVLDGTAVFENETTNGLNVFVEGGTVKGSGVVGSLTQDEGSVAPGNSPGCLTSAGDVDFGALDSTFDVELGGTTPCSGYDQMVSDTDIDLNSTALTLSLYGGFTPSAGDTFTIARAPSITGTFAGLEDDKSYANGNYIYKINYNTGVSGQDSVVLTVVPASTPTSGTIGTLPETGADSPLTFVYVGILFLLLGTSLALVRRRRRLFAAA